jgi:uncharacterized protein YjdB
MKKSLLFLILMLLCNVCTRTEVETFGTISGVVTDARTKLPVEGVSVSLEPGGITKATGKDGSYSFAGLEAMEYTLTYAKAEYLSVSKKITAQARVNAIADVSFEPEPQIPKLSVNLKSLDFGKDLGTLSLEIANTGKGTLKWSVEHEESWFRCSPVAGTTEKDKSSSVVVTVSRDRLEKGVYRNTFSIVSDGGREDITVTLEMDGVTLFWEPSELDFGTLATTLPLTLTNRGSGTVEYKVEVSNEWIIPVKLSGRITDKDYINILVNRNALSPGSYTGTVTIQSGQERFSVPVKMSIAANEKPVVGLNSVGNITYNSAVLNGIMVSVGSQRVTKHGFCWNTSPGPTVENHSSDLGDCTGPAAFEGIASNLEPDTRYYVRTYAQNAVGISYSSSELSFTTGKPPDPGVVAVTGVTIDPATLSRRVGDPAVTLTAVIIPSHATNKNVVWTSGNSNVATVADGVVNFVGAGEATITVTTLDGNKTAACAVTVVSGTAVEVPVSEVFTNKSFVLNAGLTRQLTAVVIPDNATNKNVNWRSSNTSVATVSTTGLVTAVSSGTSTITVSTEDGNKTATCDMRVLGDGETGGVGASGSYTWSFANGTLTVSGTGVVDGNMSSQMQNTLVSVIIENGITGIGSGLFSGCSELTNVSIPNSVKSIEGHAFNECISLTSITIPNSVTYMGGDKTFLGCSSLTSITIPNSVTSIGNLAFWGCSGLIYVSIPNSVVSIGGQAFEKCNALTNMTIQRRTPPAVGDYTFYGTPIGSVTLTVPSGSKAAYQKEYPWSSFKTIIEQ